MELSEPGTWWPILLLSFGTFVLVYLLRRLVEGVFPATKGIHYWTDVAMPTLPIILGGGFAVAMVKFPWPLQDPSALARLFLGFVAGFVSGWAYRIVKAFIKSKTGIDVDVPSSSSPTTKPS